MANVYYIVYRAEELKVPLGTNAVAWKSESLRSARSWMTQAAIGLDDWDKPAEGWGLILVEIRRGEESKIIGHKGLDPKVLDAKELMNDVIDALHNYMAMQLNSAHPGYKVTNELAELRDRVRIYRDSLK